MVILAFLCLIATAFLSSILTMKEGKIETVPVILIPKVIGLALLFWLPLVIVSQFGSL